MSVVIQLSGKKYTIASSSVDQGLLEKAAQLFETAAREIQSKDALLSEGQLCAMVTMRCLVPLLQEQHERERSITSCIEELTHALDG
jgi:cell division protein ZapA (FtsZ GTPase activity inhibitor)